MDARAPTLIVDRVAARLPFLYWSVRTGMLEITITSVIIWAITGFDLPEGSVPIIAIQWSTFATFAFFFYLVVANLQVGGFESLNQVLSAIKYDLLFIAHHRFGGREFYETKQSIDAVRASAFAILICMAALFLFEAIWVPFYDYFQFGSIIWPVYQAAVPLGATGITFSIAWRNIVLSIVPLFIAWNLFDALSIDGEPKSLFYRFNYRFRMDAAGLALVVLAALFWLAWIIYPHQAAPVFDVTGILAKNYDPSSCYIFPSQGLFPQNSYTFYPCGLFGKSYPLNQILGFFNPDAGLHAINVLTKFFTFLAVGYPFMLRVKRNWAQG